MDLKSVYRLGLSNISSIDLASSGLEDNIVIKLHRRIYKCNSCDKLFTKSNNLSYNPSSVSYTKIMQILKALKDRSKSFNCVANNFNLSPAKVIKIFDNHVNITRQELSEVICVDEVYSKLR